MRGQEVRNLTCEGEKIAVLGFCVFMRRLSAPRRGVDGVLGAMTCDRLLTLSQ